MDMDKVKILVSCMATLEYYIYKLYIKLSSKTRSPYNVIFKHIAEVSRGHKEIFEELFRVNPLDLEDIERHRDLVGSLFVETLTKIRELIAYIDSSRDFINNTELRDIVASLVTVESSVSEDFLNALFASLIDQNIKEDYTLPRYEADLIASLMEVISDEENTHIKLLNLVYDSL